MTFEWFWHSCLKCARPVRQSNTHPGPQECPQCITPRRPQLWAWFQCYKCGQERRFPLSWKFHTCEKCSRQMEQMSSPWTRRAA